MRPGQRVAGDDRRRDRPRRGRSGRARAGRGDGPVACDRPQRAEVERARRCAPRRAGAARRPRPRRSGRSRRPRGRRRGRRAQRLGVEGGERDGEGGVLAFEAQVDRPRRRRWPRPRSPGAASAAMAAARIVRAAGGDLAGVEALEAAAERAELVVLDGARQHAHGGEDAGRRAGRARGAMPRVRARSQACTGPEPPKARSARSRGSRPRSTVTARMARTMLALATSRTPSAASSTERPSGRGERRARWRRAPPRRRGRARRRRGGRQEAEHDVGVGDGGRGRRPGRSRPGPGRRRPTAGRRSGGRRRRWRRSSRRRCRPRPRPRSARASCSRRP